MKAWEKIAVHLAEAIKVSTIIIGNSKATGFGVFCLTIVLVVAITYHA